MALRRHQIRIRRLCGEIQKTFYAVSVKKGKSPESCEALADDYTRQVQEWYNESPLRTAFVPISNATIARQVGHAPVLETNPE